jgi:uncharacterized protein
MTVEMLDGFFAALVCSPKLVMPSEYMPHVLGEDESKLADLEEVKDFYGLVIRHWNAVARALARKDKRYDLVLVSPDDNKSYGNHWAEGFLQGVRIGGSAWSDLINDEEHGGIFVPLFALAHEHDPDPELRPNPISDDQRDLMLATISASLAGVFEYFAQHRRQPLMDSRTGQVMPKKVGRNEPCPCGSARKYKHCCGGN